ncbi:MAG TPA: hypothetical protein VK404_12250 [Spirosoma sp.]|nr:hypothetical protein [Spirosoma sp.]
MNMTKWMPILFLACTSCAKPFTLTASLNNQPWFGTGEITEIHTKENETCIDDRFSILIRTDLPFNPVNAEFIRKATGCFGKCTPTQWLGLAHIPLKKGNYDLALPDTCLPTKVAKSDQSFRVSKASLLVMDPQTGNTQMSYQFSEADKSWVEVTSLNRTNGKIRGRFEVTLASSGGGRPWPLKEESLEVN